MFDKCNPSSITNRGIFLISHLTRLNIPYKFSLKHMTILTEIHTL